MKVLVACEFSGIVRQAFRRRGHDAWSCDLLLPEDGSEFHFHGDVKAAIKWRGWEMMIAHPPCTHLCVSGARWFSKKAEEQQDSLDFVLWLAKQPIERIAIENPVGILSTEWREPDQIIQPWEFGHLESKATCLWLKNLPRLKPTNIVANPEYPLLGIPASVPEQRVFKEPPGPERWKNRSRTYSGIAEAMAEQWGELANGNTALGQGPVQDSLRDEKAQTQSQKGDL